MTDDDSAGGDVMAAAMLALDMPTPRHAWKGSPDAEETSVVFRVVERWRFG
jgi:hypothetical protein